MPPATSTTLDDMLDTDKIDALRKEYTPAAAASALTDTIGKMYGPTTGYLGAIGKAFYGITDDVIQTPSDKLTPANRERCLIALLAARGADFTLAVHIYLALMEGSLDPDGTTAKDRILPSEIANIIFLSGVYTGADNLTRGLMTLTRTLGLLANLATPGTPENVAKEIIGAFKA